MISLPECKREGDGARNSSTLLPPCMWSLGSPRTCASWVPTPCPDGTGSCPDWDKRSCLERGLTAEALSVKLAWENGVWRPRSERPSHGADGPAGSGETRRSHRWRPSGARMVRDCSLVSPRCTDEDIESWEVSLLVQSHGSAALQSELVSMPRALAPALPCPPNVPSSTPCS